jgi:acyl-CoA thioester hydrolase
MANMSDPASSSPLPLDAYPLRATDRLRYGDTDRQGHVNNAVFATFFETGRVAFLYDPESPVLPEGASFVIARLVIDFRAEINWPGEVEIGTVVSRIGRSSCTLSQAVFQNGTCVASGESVIVLMDETTRKSRPLTDQIMALLERYRR